MAKLRFGTAGKGEMPQLISGGVPVTFVDGYGTPIEDNESPMYAAQISVTPTTLTNNTVYWALQAGYNKSLRIQKFDIVTSFHGTPAASTSNFQILRLQNGLITPTHIPAVFNPWDAQPCEAALAMTNAALTITGAQYEPAGGVVLGVANQIGAGSPWNLESLRGWAVAPGRGIVIRATGAVVAGVTIRGFCLFTEVDD